MFHVESNIQCIRTSNVRVHRQKETHVSQEVKVGSSQLIHCIGESLPSASSKCNRSPATIDRFPDLIPTTSFSPPILPFHGPGKDTCESDVERTTSVHGSGSTPVSKGKERQDRGHMLVCRPWYHLNSIISHQRKRPACTHPPRHFCCQPILTPTSRRLLHSSSPLPSSPKHPNPTPSPPQPAPRATYSCVPCLLSIPVHKPRRPPYSTHQA